MAAGEPPDKALEEAVDWLLRMQAAPADPALRSRFDIWLASDPSHIGAWDRARRAWSIVGEISAGDCPSAREIVSPAPARRRSYSRRHEQGRNRRPSIRRPERAAIAATVAACLSLLAAPFLLSRAGADYATSTGEVRTVGLADGTKVQLAPKSAIDIDYGTNGRRVTLLSGEAWFEVVHDAARPFVVEAGGVNTADMGTTFDVRLDSDRTTIAVANGEVSVEGKVADRKVEARLARGEQVSIDRQTGETWQAVVPIGDVALWRTGRLFANNATVADVVDQLRPYQSGWIVITNNALAKKRVTGLYDLHHPDAALEAIVDAAGGEAHRFTPLLFVLSGC
jgi:transmembrane sensor